jgi:hypothetical protein
MLKILYALLLVAALPDSVTNPNVTENNIDDTICVRGWTRTVRPPREVTDEIKQSMLRERNEPSENARLYELDHIIPLELGGAPSSLSNLQLQPWPEAKEKDKVENCLKREVCADHLSLEIARFAIFTNWKKAKELCEL